MSVPLITVFIPTYNRADLLRETILSVFNQTHQPIQVIVLDDASTDATPQVVAEFAHDPRFTSVRHPKNIGMAANWRAGIELVSTPFFCLLNDDDLLAPDCMARLLEPMQQDPEIIVSFCDHWVIDATGQRLLQATEETTARHGRKDLSAGLFAGFGEATILHRSLHISCSLLRSALVPADFIEERAQGFACGWLFYQCYRTGHPAFYTPARLVSYRVHEGNMLTNPKMTGYINEGQIFCCSQLLEAPLPEPLRSQTRKQIASIYCSHAFGLLSAGRQPEAGEFFRRSLGIRASVKAFAGLGLSSLGPTGRNLLQFARKLLRREATVLQQIFAPLVCTACL